jgi:hypothetical protein
MQFYLVLSLAIIGGRFGILGTRSYMNIMVLSGRKKAKLSNLFQAVASALTRLKFSAPFLLRFAAMPIMPITFLSSSAAIL